MALSEDVLQLLEQDVELRRRHSSENVTRKHYVQKTHEAPDSTNLLEAFGQRLE